MNVWDIMTPNVICVYKSDTLAKAMRLMDSEKTHHLPVIEADGSLAGIVSDRDCKDALAVSSRFYDNNRKTTPATKILVKQIMTPAPVWITPHSSVHEAASLMLEKHINALPVIHDSTIIGIVTSTDLLRVLAKQTEV
jgi:CBS domain-containing protein